MKTVKIIVAGCGGVGRAFLQLLADRSEEIRKTYGLNLVLCAAVDYKGAALDDSDSGLRVDQLVAFVNQGSEVQTFGSHGREDMTGVDVIHQVNADVLVEATPTNLDDGRPGKDHVFSAITRGMEIVSANKGPFVLFYEELFNKALENNCGLHISAATAAALPTLDVGLTCLAGAGILSVEGILNGTTNYILSEMRNNGTAYDVALKNAQDMGIAESDPSYDVEGKDTANKIILIANRLFNESFGLSDIDPVGITGVTPDDIQRAGKEGKVIKLIGTIEPVNGKLILSVAPKWLDAEHPLAMVNGSEKAITYMTDTMGAITVMGGKSSPVGAAAALLKDLINAFK